jgi:hypothetical protein
VHVDHAFLQFRGSEAEDIALDDDRRGDNHQTKRKPAGRIADHRADAIEDGNQLAKHRFEASRQSGKAAP